MKSNRQVVWTLDSKAFEYSENTDKGAKIWRQKLIAETNPETILTVNDAKFTHFVWTSDEKTLIFPKGNQTMDAIQLTDFR